MRRRNLILLYASVFAVMIGVAAVVGPARLARITAVFARPNGRQAPHPAAASGTPATQLDASMPESICVPLDVVRRLGIRTTAARTASQPVALSLTGSLAFDANHLAHIHPRFAGEVVEIGTVPLAPNLGADSGSGTRPLRFGDEVKQGQVLAVLWSTALGEKKSEYADALSRLRIEQETLRRLETLLKDDAVPERNVREARRAVEAAEIAVLRVERTLQSWRLTDAEIDEIKAEVEQLRQQKSTRDKDRERSWARLEVRAPFSGTIVEKNIAPGDIVDATTELFKVADLRRLAVWAHVFEEDLFAVLALPAPIRWTVRLKSNPSAAAITGTIAEIGDIIDPSQHTALVMGYVDNPRGQLRAGQFVVATIDLPPGPDELEIPTPALLEDGDESVIFVQADPTRPCYTLLNVEIVRHTQELAFIRAAAPRRPSASPNPIHLHPGQRVVTSGGLLLRAALADLKAKAKTKD